MFAPQEQKKAPKPTATPAKGSKPSGLTMDGQAEPEDYDRLKQTFWENSFVASSGIDRVWISSSVAPRIAEIMNEDQAIKDGPGFMIGMLNLGDEASARVVFEKITNAHTREWGMGKSPTSAADVTDLLIAASNAASSDNYDLAEKILRFVFVFAQVLAWNVSSMRQTALAKANDELAANPSATAQMPIPYSGIEPSALIREVYDFYPIRERAARDGGDHEWAEKMRLLGLELNENLQTEVLGRSLMREPLLTAALQKTPDERGNPGYSVSSDGKTEVLGSMPNLPSIAGDRHFSGLRQHNQDTVEALRGQSEFLAEVLRFPAVRKEFPNDPPRMELLADRVRLWNALLPELGGQLQTLIGFMGRHLESFTKHSMYNVRDFGQNYLETDFPQDFAGRLVQDCGVYALTVAYELIQVSRSGNLNIDVRLATTTDHAMLAIIDNDSNTAYVLNNDEFKGPIPNTDEAIHETMARAHGETFSHEHTFIGMMTFNLGRTKEAGKKSEKALKRDLWDKYQAAAQWGFVPRQDQPDPNQEYYNDRAAFDRQQRNLIEVLAILDATYLAPKKFTKQTATDLSSAVELGINILKMYEFNRCRPLGPGSKKIGKEQVAMGAKYVFVASDKQSKGSGLEMLEKAIAVFKANQVSVDPVLEQEFQARLRAAATDTIQCP